MSPSFCNGIVQRLLEGPLDPSSTQLVHSNKAIYILFFSFEKPTYVKHDEKKDNNLNQGLPLLLNFWAETVIIKKAQIKYFSNHMFLSLRWKK